ncbi:MAG: hypothetical protein CMJ95_14445 [Planctomycetes bacterium]|nr:hypothetical protein [Planctomycetota bacterium]
MSNEQPDKEHRASWRIFIGLVAFTALLWWVLPRDDTPGTNPTEGTADSVAPTVAQVVQEVASQPQQEPVVVIQVVNDSGPVTDARIEFLSEQEECLRQFESNDEGQVTVPQAVIHCSSIGLVHAPGHAVAMVSSKDLASLPSVFLGRLGAIRVEVATDPSVKLSDVEVYLVPLSPSPVVTLQQVRAAWTLWVDGGDSAPTNVELPVDLLGELAGDGEFPIGEEFVVLPDSPALLLSTAAEGPNLNFASLPAGQYRFRVHCEDSVTCTPSDEAQVASVGSGGQLRVDSRVHRKPEFDLSGVLEVRSGEEVVGAVWVHIGVLVTGVLPIPIAGVQAASVLLRHDEMIDGNGDGIADYGTSLREHTVEASDDGSFSIYGVREGEKSLAAYWISVVDGVQHIWMAWRSFRVDGPGEYDLGILDPAATMPVKGVVRIVDGNGGEINKGPDGKPLIVSMGLTTTFSPQNRRGVSATLELGMPFALHGLSDGETLFEFDPQGGGFGLRGNNYVTIDAPPSEPLIVEFVKLEFGNAKVQVRSEAKMRIHVRHPASGWSNSFLTLAKDGISSTGSILVPVGECHLLIQQFKQKDGGDPNLFATQIFQVSDDATAESPEFIEPELLSGSTLSVLAHGPDGRPVGGKQIEISGAGWNRVWRAFTDENGRTVIRGMPPGIEINCRGAEGSWITARPGGVIEMKVRFSR